MIKLRARSSPEELASAKALFEDYARSLDFDLDFQNFDRELSYLPGAYCPPEGDLLLACYENQDAGCVALKKLEPMICEMKRLYIKLTYRSKGIGKLLVDGIIRRACEVGYTRMHLDTIHSMQAAQRLYEAAGFKDIEPYCHNPIPGTRFLELALKPL